MVRFPSERLGGQLFSPAMQGFSDFITSLGLVDPPLKRGSFTWSNNREVESMSCIDRFLYSLDWEDQFPSIIQRKLLRLMLDHFPILLECGQLQRCKCPFRFENMFRAEGFLDHVRQWWDSYQFNGTPSFVLANKLKALNVDLKKWNAESFGNVVIKKTKLLHDLHELDSVAERLTLTSDEKA